jgi:regulator of sigma E protease
MLSVLIFALVLGILIFVHEFGHFIVAKKNGVRVERFSLGFGRVLLKTTKGGTEYCLSAIPLGGYVKMAGDTAEDYKGTAGEYFASAPGKRFWIIMCGPFVNYLLGFLCFWFIFVAGYPTLTTKVGGVLDGYGAKDAGIRQGDVIIAVDNEAVASWDQMVKLIQGKKDALRVHLSVRRAEQTLPIDVLMRQENVDDPLNGKRLVGMLGVTASYDEIVTKRHPVHEAFILGAQETWNLTVITYKGLWMLITGKLSMRESMTGPLGIFVMTSEVVRGGFIAIMHLIAALSISLALFNVLPLPVLDGGHIVLLLIEKIRGKMLSQRVEGAITQVGLTFIIGLALMVTYNDVVRIFGSKIAKFFN